MANSDTPKKLAEARTEELKAKAYREKHEPFLIPEGYPIGVSRWEDRYAASYASTIRQEERNRCAEIARKWNRGLHEGPHPALEIAAAIERGEQ